MKPFDIDSAVGELQQDIVSFQRRAEDCDKLRQEVPTDDSDMNVRQHVRLKAKAATYRHCAELLQNTLKRIGWTPIPETGEIPEDLVKLVRSTSMASDQIGDELVLKVFGKLWQTDCFTPKIEPEEEEALALLRRHDENDAWNLITRILKRVGHY